MAIKLEKVVEKFYLGLEEGKILGRKCPKCGNVEFPPVYACNACGNYETEWVEISGKAKLHSIVLPAALSSKPEYKKFKKFCYGEIELEEGSRFNGVVLGVSKKNRLPSYHLIFMPKSLKEILVLKPLYLNWMKIN